MTTSADRPRFLRSAGIPPALRAALGEVLDHFDDDLLLDDEPSEWLLAQMEFVFDRGEPVWARAPELADLGTALLDRRQHPEIRRWGCIWLTQFPTPENVEALAKVALDPGEPKRLRSQAAWSLGFRQLQGRHPSLRWTPEALAMADRALLALVEGTADRIELEELPLALRHVDHPGVLNALARRALFWAEALEAFATPALAALRSCPRPSVARPARPRPRICTPSRPSPATPRPTSIQCGPGWSSAPGSRSRLRLRLLARRWL